MQHMVLRSASDRGCRNFLAIHLKEKSPHSWLAQGCEHREVFLEGVLQAKLRIILVFLIQNRGGLVHGNALVLLPSQLYEDFILTALFLSNSDIVW